MNVLNEIKSGFNHYSRIGNDYFFGRPSIEEKKLPAGIYTINLNQAGEAYVSGMSALTDNLIRLPDFTSEKVIKDVEKFWSNETKARFAKRQLLYKRGILLHGVPGVGKSACISQIMEAEVNAGGIVFFSPSPSLLSSVVKNIREIEKERSRRVLVVWEEFDELIESDESSFLSLMDGEMQIDNVVYLATTNHLNRIPARFTRRPSRFASIINIDLPNAETRRVYLENKVQAEDNIDMNQWVKATDGFTIDHLKDLIISVLCLDVPFEEAIERLKEFSYDDEKDNVDNKKTRLRNKLFGHLLHREDEDHRF